MTKALVIRIVKWVLAIVLSLALLVTGGLYFFKDQIIGAVVTEMNKHLKSKVKIQSVDIAFWSSFPNLSVDLNHVFVPDAYENASDHDTLFFSDKIRLRFNPMDLWHEEYRLKRIDIYPGTLRLKVNHEGKENYDIFKESEDTTSSNVQFDLQKVFINNLRFSYTDLKIDHRYATDLITTELEGSFAEKVFTIHAKSHQMIRETRSGKVNFVRNRTADLDIDVEIDQNKGTLLIPKTTIYIASLPFHFYGFLSPEEMKFTIDADKLSLVDVAQNLSMNEVKEVQTYSGTGTVKFALLIEDQRRDDSPVTLECNFGVQNGQLTEPASKLTIQQLNVDGQYSNRGGKSKEFLDLRNIRFQTKTGPFAGTLKITQFNAPRFEGSANGNLNLHAAHLLFPVEQIEKMGGSMDVNAQFIFQLLADKQTDISKLEGNLQFNDAYLQLKEDKRYFNTINGRLFLKNNDFGVDDLKVKLGQSDVAMNGLFTNLVAYLKGSGNLQADVTIKSKLIRLEDLGSTSKEVQTVNNAPRTFILPNNIIGSMLLSVDRLSYEGHLFDQIQGKLSMSGRKMAFNDIKFKTSGANISGNVSIHESSEEYFYTVSNLLSSNIQLKQLLKDWKNFSQDVIRDDHISGQAAAQLYLEAPFDLRTGIQMKAIKSDLNIKIVDGRLKGVETFKSMVASMNTPATKLLLGANNIKAFGEKLSDLKFETLENTFVIRDGVITIPSMKMNSNALNIEASGKHGFDNTIDYRFSFRLRDLKEKKQSEFGEIVDDNTGMLVYLRMYGTIENPKFQWDKESKAAARQEYNEQEKQNVKSMLKSEFGLFKKDSTVQKYESVTKPREVLEVQYGEDNSQKDEFETEKKKKDSKLNGFFKKMEQEDKSRKKVEVEFD